MAVIHRSKFQFEDRWVPFGRASLETDHIRLSGLGFRRRVELENIIEMYWYDDLITLRLRNGDILEMNIPNAALWRYELQTLCGMQDAESNAGMFLRSVRKELLQQPVSGDGASVSTGDGAAISVEKNINISVQPTRTSGDGQKVAVDRIVLDAVS